MRDLNGLLRSERAAEGNQEQSDRERIKPEVGCLGSCKRATWHQPSSLWRGGGRRGWAGRWPGRVERKGAGSISDVARGCVKVPFSSCA